MCQSLNNLCFFVPGSQIKPITSDLGSHLFQEGFHQLPSLRPQLPLCFQELLIQPQWYAIKVSSGALSPSCLSQGHSRVPILSVQVFCGCERISQSRQLKGERACFGSQFQSCRVHGGGNGTSTDRGNNSSSVRPDGHISVHI